MRYLFRNIPSWFLNVFLNTFSAHVLRKNKTRNTFFTHYLYISWYDTYPVNLFEFCRYIVLYSVSDASKKTEKNSFWLSTCKCKSTCIFIYIDIFYLIYIYYTIIFDTVSTVESTRGKNRQEKSRANDRNSRIYLHKSRKLDIRYRKSLTMYDVWCDIF